MDDPQVIFALDLWMRSWEEESLVSFQSTLSLFLRRAIGSPLPFLLPPCAAPFSQVSLGRILLAREMNPFFRAGFTLCGSLAGPLTPHLFDYFFAVAWGGLATCWRRTSERILSVCCAARFHLVSRGFTKSWVGQVACALQPTGMR